MAGKTLLEFLSNSSQKSSMRLSMFMIVTTVCACLIYLTIVAGVEVAPYLVMALSIGVTGKAVQSFAELKVGRNIKQLNEEEDVQNSTEPSAEY